MKIYYDEKCVSQNCETIYSVRHHATLGISPFNSYFSEQNILLLVEWVSKNFNNFNIFVPDTLPIHTFIALGYEQARAIKKQKDNYPTSIIRYTMYYLTLAIQMKGLKSY